MDNAWAIRILLSYMYCASLSRSTNLDQGQTVSTCCDTMLLSETSCRLALGKPEVFDGQSMGDFE